ncbi:MAG: hypothetical protein AUJ92_20095 [Armatimonadetes bacterium CG2_30_59_28]|nr:histidinol-phosphatase HisJ family protein [Armatimonadota bacterium]OIO89916.1 MAG: hypothetical protein AUJ92_20095 [Armatimonadetes bacterium CG2_30_59_28]PIU60473.1 MAG: hypothetical protein COS85_24345 [Armatimonadetes bacterium CG07_land_8_20_14_0_80_59_28]PIX43286.1 MAG: hypothetical protein COZ56_07495 [Armatimonadetes bacterium CG_4_8_14_3_um_filter_58_9]PIY47445.1 MAG: hypothetical protein COZ05_05035 [Armatimonadetes bacterium CG_4_10_14_3_um_filter_59_10]PJB70305.1 MAG: hypothet
MYASLHTHSRWSDGKCSIQGMVAAAEAAGAAEYGVSDHFVLRPDGVEVDWSMPLASVSEYLDDVCEVREGARVPVRLGVEIDFFPETCGLLEKRLGSHIGRLDYIVGSIHYVDDFPVDADASYWTPLTQDQIDGVHEAYWTRLRQLAEWGRVDFLGHIDLPKKFAYYPTIDLSGRITDALDAIAAADLAVEVNTAGWDKPCAEAYPSETILAQCIERNIPVLINDDAHQTSHIGRHYNLAAELLQRVGYSETVRFRGRERTSVPL